MSYQKETQERIMTTLTDKQLEKLAKLSPHSPDDAIIREVDGNVSVTWWTSIRTWHEIIFTPKGRIVRNYKGQV